jgi:hypothetical protein
MNCTREMLKDQKQTWKTTLYSTGIWQELGLR